MPCMWRCTMMRPPPHNALSAVPVLQLTVPSTAGLIESVTKIPAFLSTAQSDSHERVGGFPADQHVSRIRRSPRSMDVYLRVDCVSFSESIIKVPPQFTPGKYYCLLVLYIVTSVIACQPVRCGVIQR
jgi:hypothetical protein